LVVIVAGGLGLTTAQRAGSSSAFTAIFDQYLHGDADAAVRALAAWSEVRVDAEATPLPESADPWMLAARALLHTEAGLLNETFAGRPHGGDPRNSWPLETHARTAFALVERLVAEAGTDPSLRAFCVEWTMFASSFSERVFRGYGLGQTSRELARQHLFDRPVVRLHFGSLAEISTGPLIDRAYASNVRVEAREDEHAWVSMVHGLFSPGMRGRAESLLRDAIDGPDKAPEARVRLGRLGFLTGRPRPSEARALLEGALADGRAADDRFVSYLAALLLGAMHEHDRRLDEAARMYRTAIDLEPRAHPAHVALSQLRLAQGRTGEAWAVMNELFAAAGPGGDIWSPWALYPFAQFHKSAERLDAMRRLVAEQFGRERRSNLPFPYLDPPPPQTRVATLDRSDLTPKPAAQDRLQATGFQTSVEGVRVDVTVMDGDEPVTGLTAEDFWVLDNGRAQRIESAATIPHLAVAMAFDVSHDGPVPLRDHLVPAARLVVGALRPGDRVSVLTIEDSVRLLARGDTDLSRAHTLLENLTSVRHRWTALWDGAYSAASLVAQDAGRPVVVLFSDHGGVYGGGGENVSWLRYEEARDRLRASGVTVDAVWVAGQRSPPDFGYPGMTDIVWGRWMGDDVVKATGGRVFRVEDPDLAQAIRQRLDRLRSGYVLTYVPTGVRTGDGWHKLEVRLRNKRGQVTARAGYYSGRPTR
jgi:VWFA-related protein